MTIGERIRNIRKTRKLTQVEVAKTAGIAVNSLRLYEAGKRQPNIETIEELAKVLGVSIADILFEDPESKSFYLHDLESLDPSASKKEIEAFEKDFLEEELGLEFQHRLIALQKMIDMEAGNYSDDDLETALLMWFRPLTKFSKWLAVEMMYKLYTNKRADDKLSLFYKKYGILGYLSNEGDNE